MAEHPISERQSNIDDPSSTESSPDDILNSESIPTFSVPAAGPGIPDPIPNSLSQDPSSRVAGYIQPQIRPASSTRPVFDNGAPPRHMSCFRSFNAEVVEEDNGHPFNRTESNMMRLLRIHPLRTSNQVECRRTSTAFRRTMVRCSSRKHGQILTRANLCRQDVHNQAVIATIMGVGLITALGTCKSHFDLF